MEPVLHFTTLTDGAFTAIVASRLKKTLPLLSDP